MQTWLFEKEPMPDGVVKKRELGQKLAETYHVSLLEYARSLEVTPDES